MEFRLSTWEIVGVVFSAVAIVLLVGTAVVDPTSSIVLWYLPNLAFALGVAIVAHRFNRQNRPLTFKTAVLVTIPGLCVTTVLSIALFSIVLHLPLSQIDLTGFYDSYLAVWVLPVVCMFPLGAADRDAERLLVGGFLLFNALLFMNQYNLLHHQLYWFGVCLLGSLLGYPLAVIGSQSQQRVRSSPETDLGTR